MKTAMQILLEELKDANSTDNFIKTTMNLIIDMVESKLETEKQQIIEAYSSADKVRPAYKDAEDYFKATFNNQCCGRCIDGMDECVHNNQ